MAGVGGDLVFCREDGRPINPKPVAEAFDRAAERLGLPRIRLHDLPHTFATLAHAADVQSKVVAELLGHASVSTTLTIYAHVVHAKQEEAVERFAALLRPE